MIQPGAPDAIVVRSAEGAGQGLPRPATLATNAATALAFAPERRPAGMRLSPVPPMRTALSTRCSVTSPIWSRFGPVTPRALTAARLWHEAPGWRNSCLPLAWIFVGLTLASVPG